MEIGPENMENIAQSAQGKTVEPIVQVPTLRRRTVLAGAGATLAGVLAAGRPEAAGAQGVPSSVSRADATATAAKRKEDEINQGKAQATAQARPTVRPAVAPIPAHPPVVYDNRLGEKKRSFDWGWIWKPGLVIGGVVGVAARLFRKTIGKKASNTQIPKTRVTVGKAASWIKEGWTKGH